jgi:hypothetical protein
MVRRNFDRVQEIRRQHMDDFDLQIIIADTQQELIDRARTLRKQTPGDISEPISARPLVTKSQSEEAVNSELPARRLTAAGRASEPAVANEPDAAEIPPEVPKLDKKSWQLAVGLAVLFTVGICAAFFYLIQTARRLNFSTNPPAVATEPQPPSSAKPAPAAATAANATPATVSMTPTLRLYTDLTGGTATIDDQAPKDLVDGELDLDSLVPGEHSVRVESRNGSAAFTFSVDNDKDVPRVTNILKSNNAMAVMVSVKDGSGHLTTDAAGAQVDLDQKPVGTAGPDGLLLSDLGNQDHDLLISQAHDTQKFVLTYTPAPTLTVFVKSDPSTGVLTVSTGLDGVSVFINDLPYKRPTEHGQIRIPLKVGSYRIRVHKDGFADPAIAMVDIKKSAESSVLFHLLAAPELATLLIKGAQPGTVAYIDHVIAATSGADGTAKVTNVKPGVHIIELHHDQEVTKELARTFDVGEVVTLTGADVALDRLAADNKSVIPANPGSVVIPPPEVPQLQPTAASAVSEQVHKGGGFIPYHTPRTPGSYYFQVHGKLGGLLKHGKIQWYAGYQDPGNYVLFSLDGKHAEVKEVRDGKATDLGKIPFSLGSDEWVQIEMSVKPDALQVRAKAGLGDWTSFAPVSTANHDFTKDSVGLYVPSNDEVAVANFHFTGR